MPKLTEVFKINEAPQKVVYLGWFLSEQSRQDLQAAFPLKYPGKQVDHVTFAFGPKPEVVEAFAAAVGQTAEGVVTGYFEDEKGQAVTIDVQSPIPATNKILHVTLATAEGVKPVYSNQLVANPAARQEVKPLKLTGVYDYFPRTVPNP
jgi:hypothetical protein